MTLSEKIVLSGIQPSNDLHLGNFLGAVRNWTGLQQRHHCFYMMVDLHAITAHQNPEQLREACYRGFATYIAAGLDPDKSILFMQSHVPCHSQLAWLIICSTYMGELSRMTQYKDKSQKQERNIPAGLFIYPSLMAADILLYQADLIPVGEDQKQHVELARNLAVRLNNRFGLQVFKVPGPLIADTGCRVMDLQHPTRKMSKSAENTKGIIFLHDSDKQIIKKFKSAVTDSGSEVTTYEAASPGVRNLIDILAAVSRKNRTDIIDEFLGKQYGLLKLATAEAVVALLSPIRQRANELLSDKAVLDQFIRNGADKARQEAEKTLKKVMNLYGFIPFT